MAACMYTQAGTSSHHITTPTTSTTEQSQAAPWSFDGPHRLPNVALGQPPPPISVSPSHTHTHAFRLLPTSQHTMHNDSAAATDSQLSRPPLASIPVPNHGASSSQGEPLKPRRVSEPRPHEPPPPMRDPRDPWLQSRVNDLSVDLLPLHGGTRKSMVVVFAPHQH